MMRRLVPILIALALSGCALLSPERSLAPATGQVEPLPGAESAPTGAAASLGSASARAEDLDLTTPEEKAAALAAAPASGERALGRVVVALGPPAEQGLWLSSALVTEVRQGRIETAQGTSLAVELRPAEGPALMSLAAFQALGLPLTGLPEILVFAN